MMNETKITLPPFNVSLSNDAKSVNKIFAEQNYNKSIQENNTAPTILKGNRSTITLCKLQPCNATYWNEKYFIYRDDNIKKKKEIQCDNELMEYWPVLANLFTKYIFGNQKAPQIINNFFQSYEGSSMEYFDFNDKNTNNNPEVKQMQLVQNILDINECKFDFHNTTEAKKIRKNITDYTKDRNGEQLEFCKKPMAKNDILLELLLYTLLTAKTDIKNRNICCKFDTNEKPYLCHIDFDHFDYDDEETATMCMFDSKFFEKNYKDMFETLLLYVSPTKCQFLKNKEYQQTEMESEIQLYISRPIHKENVSHILPSHKDLIETIIDKFNPKNFSIFYKEALPTLYRVYTANKELTEEQKKEFLEKCNKSFFMFIEQMFSYYNNMLYMLSNNQDYQSSSVLQFITKKLKLIIDKNKDAICNKNNYNYYNEENINNISEEQIEKFLRNTRDIDDLTNYKQISSKYFKNKKLYDTEKEVRKEKYNDTKYSASKKLPDPLQTQKSSNITNNTKMETNDDAPGGYLCCLKNKTAKTNTKDLNKIAHNQKNEGLNNDIIFEHSDGSEQGGCLYCLKNKTAKTNTKVLNTNITINK